MQVNEITKVIVDLSYQLHRELGPGLFESVYEAVLSDALIREGLKTVRQRIIPISFRGMTYDEGFRADLVVEESVIVEIKSVESLARVHKKNF